jgi:hypothetical protein
LGYGGHSNVVDIFEISSSKSTSNDVSFWNVWIHFDRTFWNFKNTW